MGIRACVRSVGVGAPWGRFGPWCGAVPDRYDPTPDPLEAAIERLLNAWNPPVGRQPIRVALWDLVEAIKSEVAECLFVDSEGRLGRY